MSDPTRLHRTPPSAHSREGVEAEERRGRPEAAAVAWWRGTPPELGPEPPSILRQALLRALVGALAGGVIFLFWHRPLAYVVWGITAFVLAAALASPAGLYAAIERALAALAYAVGRVLTVVLLTPLYYFFFAPFGQVLRRGRRDRMQPFFEPRATTYWHRREDGPRRLEHYERQF